MGPFRGVRCGRAHPFSSAWMDPSRGVRNSQALHTNSAWMDPYRGVRSSRAHHHFCARMGPFRGVRISRAHQFSSAWMDPSRGVRNSQAFHKNGAWMDPCRGVRSCRAHHHFSARMDPSRGVCSSQALHKNRAWMDPFRGCATFTANAGNDRSNGASGRQRQRHDGDHHGHSNHGLKPRSICSATCADRAHGWIPYGECAPVEPFKNVAHGWIPYGECTTVATNACSDDSHMHAIYDFDEQADPGRLSFLTLRHQPSLIRNQTVHASNKINMLRLYWYRHAVQSSRQTIYAHNQCILAITIEKRRQDYRSCPRRAPPTPSNRNHHKHTQSRTMTADNNCIMIKLLFTSLMLATRAKENKKRRHRSRGPSRRASWNGNEWRARHHQTRTYDPQEAQPKKSALQPPRK